MASSLTETMTVPPAMESMQMRLKPIPRSTSPSGLYRPVQSPDRIVTKTAAATGGMARVRFDPQRALQPARKKLSTLEAQRIMAVLTTMIRRAELASVLPHLAVAQRRENSGTDHSIALGADLSRLVKEYSVLLESSGELKAAERKCQRRVADSQQSSGSNSACSRHLSASVQTPTSVAGENYQPASQCSNEERKSTSPVILESLQAASRNLALVEHRMQVATRNILRAFTLNPSASDSILNNADEVRSKSAEEFINHLKGLRDFLMSRMLTTPVEEVERTRFLREIAEKERYNAGISAKLTDELQAVEQLRDTDIAKQNDIIRRLQAELHKVERASEDSVRKLQAEAEKQVAADQKNNESRLSKQQQDLGHVRAQYSNLLAQHRDSEQALRKRKFQVETEVENWIQKFDGDMGERQDEYEQIDAIYTEEKRQLNELEERFKTLEIEYNRIMEDRRIARETREAAERELQTCIRAALTIQAFWRSFKVRKAIKAKKKKGGGKGGGVKKGKK